MSERGRSASDNDGVAEWRANLPIFARSRLILSGVQQKRHELDVVLELKQIAQIVPPFGIFGADVNVFAKVLVAKLFVGTSVCAVVAAAIAVHADIRDALIRVLIIVITY